MTHDAASLEEDARWIRTIQSGDHEEREEAFRRLLVKYWRLIAVLTAQRIGDRREAEDITQEAFLRAFRSIHSLSKPMAFLGWLLKISRNLATDHLRSRRVSSPLDSIGDLPGGIEPDEPLEARDEKEHVLEAVAELPEKYREVITLKYIQGLDGKGMARLLDEPEGTVRNRLFRALEKLRAALERKRLRQP
ncbi:MAG: sigma-70 family RNA polymerase sigma factor [Planctomycetes bacterium]|nr:sigma-70 family RNA polymerase sigma factor [Planctomycetota bacterium]